MYRFSIAAIALTCQFLSASALPCPFFLDPLRKQEYQNLFSLWTKLVEARMRYELALEEPRPQIQEASAGKFTKLVQILNQETLSPPFDGLQLEQECRKTFKKYEAAIARGLPLLPHQYATLGEEIRQREESFEPLGTAKALGIIRESIYEYASTNPETEGRAFPGDDPTYFYRRNTLLSDYFESISALLRAYIALLLRN